MKLLLTSAGFTNNSIINALQQLAQKPFDELKVVFIPTAANVEEDSKDWLIDDMYRANCLNFKVVDIVDFTALPKSIWQKRLQSADIIIIGGGNTYYLAYAIKKYGLDEELKELIKTKVYVGISAGSMVLGNSVALSDSKKVIDNNILLYKEKGLGITDFLIKPHFNSPYFPDANSIDIAKKKQILQIKESVYLIDDMSAVLINGSKLAIISEGNWEKIV